MAMNPRTHPRGAPPSFALPRPNPNPGVMTDALWWLVCMRELLEPDLSGNGGTYANKSGSHNIGANLPDYGEGDPRTDHSIRHAWNRTGPWWRSKTAAHDWTFWDAQRGDYRTINKYTRRQIAAMSDPHDLRTDRAVFYVLGNVDGDVTTEGYNEIDNDPETSGDNTHAWHIHDSFFRDAVGSFAAMWRVLTVDMGWTYAEWQRSVAIEEDDVALTVADIKLLATTQIWPAPPTSGIAGPLSLQDLLSRTYIRSMEGRNFASNINAALAAYIAAEATDDRAKTAALAELRKTIGDAQVAEASRDTQNMTDLFTRIAELASASGGVTADMLLTALREIYGEAFTRAVEANADRLPRNVVTRATDAGELPEASES